MFHARNIVLRVNFDAYFQSKDNIQRCKPNFWGSCVKLAQGFEVLFWEKRTGTELGELGTSVFFDRRLRTCPQTTNSGFAIIATHWLRLLRLPKVLPMQMQVLLLQHGRNRSRQMRRTRLQQQGWILRTLNQMILSCVTSGARRAHVDMKGLPD